MTPPRPPRPLAFAASLVLVAAALALLVLLRTALLFGFGAVLLAVILTYPIDLLARLRVPRGLAVVLTLLLLLAALAGGFRVAAPVAYQQVQRVLPTVQQAWSRGARWWERTSRQQLPAGAEVAEHVRERSTRGLAAVVSEALPVAWSTLEGAGALVLLLALAAFLAYEPDSYRRAARALVPPGREAAFDEVWARVGGALRRWLGGIVVAMAAMGALTAVGLLLAGVDGWLALGLLTFFGTFVPYAGALASAIPGLVVGLSQSPRHFLLALGVYAVVHLVEGYLAEPLIMRRAVRLRPATLLFWQVVIGTLLGGVGIVAATPLLVCFTEAIDALYTERTLHKQPPE